MLRPRVIPALLLQRGALVKTVGFTDPKYVGDPINAVRIFNEKEADELTILDIGVSANQSEPDYRLIEKVAAECRMPLCYGGGVATPSQAKRIIDLGVEKVSLGRVALVNPEVVAETASELGRQSVVVTLDVIRRKRRLSRGYEVCSLNATQRFDEDPVVAALRMESLGAGEIVLNSVERDGAMQGYDLELASRAREALGVPLTILGGAGSLQHVEELITSCGLVGAAAGSLFVFKGPYRAVLINYPTWDRRDELFPGLG